MMIILRLFAEEEEDENPVILKSALYKSADDLYN